MTNDEISFVEFVDKHLMSSYSQNLQNLWGLWENIDNQDTGYFVEFGALSGINLSNSYLMELLGWNGIVAEPHPNYKVHIDKNRNCHKSYDAVYSESNKKFDFKIFKGFPARSTLKKFERLEDK